MLAIACIFMLVFTAGISSILVGIQNVILYRIAQSKNTIKTKNILTIGCYIISSAIFLFLVIWGMVHLIEWLCSTNVGSYIAVIIYTLLLALMAADILYLSPSENVDSISKAFRRGFTSGSINNIIPNLYLKTIINLFYLVILILAQIEDLGFASFPDGVSYFFTLNKYGIVIVFAIEKIIKSLAPERKRMKILTEAFVEQENRDERDREERRNTFKEIKVIMKERKAVKKRIKEESKKNKDK